MPKTTALTLMIVLALVGCSKNDAESSEPQSGDGSGSVVKGSDAAMPTVWEAVRVWTRQPPTIDRVAAELEGVIMARTSSQAIMHYDGYRVILTTPGDMVTRIVFQFDPGTRPTIYQFTETYGMAKEMPRGMLYTYEAPTTGQKINILARTEAMPAQESTEVLGLVIEGARVR
ncbi:MAG: hypothetical protein WBG86_17955 [Polyangiales bacterium]